MRKFQIDFPRVPVGFTFQNGGNTWIKQSTRTARIVDPDYYKRWFYFNKADQCVVTRQTEFATVGSYGLYKLTLIDGFIASINASSERDAIDTLIRAGVFNAPESAIYACSLIKQI